MEISMKNGFETLLDVFDAIIVDNLITKREIADKLGLSATGVSKAAGELISAGLISTCGAVPSKGRSAEALSPTYSKKYAIVNLCEKPFTYSIAYLGEGMAANGRSYMTVKSVPYIRDLDFGENVARLANRLANLGEGISTAAIALPSPDDLPEDYLGDDIPSLFARRSITPLVIGSRIDALYASSTIKGAPLPSLYISVGRGVRGVYLGKTALQLNWDGVNIDGLLLSEIIRCASSPSRLADRLEKLIVSASELLGTKSVMLDATYISAETVEILLARLPFLKDVTFNSPVHEGLSRLLAIELIKILPSVHERKKP